MSLDFAPTPVRSRQLDELATDTFERLGGNVVAATPLGVGKPIRLVNALYRHALDHPGTSLTIVTALTLDEAAQSFELACRLAGPMVERLSGGGPEPGWKRDRRAKRLPRVDWAWMSHETGENASWPQPT